MHHSRFKLCTAIGAVLHKQQRHHVLVHIVLVVSLQQSWCDLGSTSAKILIESFAAYCSLPPMQDTRTPREPTGSVAFEFCSSIMLKNCPQRQCRQADYKLATGEDANLRPENICSSCRRQHRLLPLAVSFCHLCPTLLVDEVVRVVKRHQRTKPGSVA